MANRFLPLLLVLVLAPAARSAPLDPETTAPYRWRVVVRFDPHPLLGPVFRSQITHDIKAALQPALGEVGRVEVFDLDAVPEADREPLWQEFAREGWPALEAPRFRELTGVKTHFLRVVVANGAYRLEARQHDGSTGLTSPLVRTRETRTPETVARLAGLMLDRDFGPVGTVERIDKEPDVVRVRFRGGALPGFERFIKPGDVFAVSLIREQVKQAPTPPGEKPRIGAKAPEPVRVPVGQPHGIVLLRAEGPVADGACRCQVLTGYKNPLPTGRGILGIRCLKLATVEAPVEVRVVDPQGRPQVGGQLLQVRATDTNFAASLDARDALELRGGVFRSARPLRNVACVVVSLGSNRTAPFAVPVLGEGPVTLWFEADPEAIARARFEQECLDLRGRVADARTSQAELIRALTRLILQGKNPEALEQATAGLALLDAVVRELSTELERLKGQPGAGEPAIAALLEAAGRQLEAIRADRGAIEEKARELGEAVTRTEADPVRFEREFRTRELTARIRQLIEQGEIPEALDLYDELFNVSQNPEVKEQKARLAKEWEPRDDEHRKARDYVTGEWRRTTGLDGFRAALDPLTEAAGVLTTNNDRFGLRNLLSSLEPAYARLKEVLDTLDPNAEADREAVKEVQAVLQALRKIEEDARAKLRDLESAAGKGP
jgi:tetratricopeptide (TPR) repeat protein